MGLFNMLESFFFVTLGISCVLLMMLIYHFKQRINKLENNNRMMFDVINKAFFPVFRRAAGKKP